MKVLIQKNMKTIFLVVLLIKLFVLMIDLVNQLLYIEAKMQLMNLLKQFLKNINIAKKIINKRFNKYLIMTEEEEDLFQKSNNCWVCKKFISNDEDKVRDHCHITGKFRGAAHKTCNLNFKLTKKVPVIFHNLRGYDSHLIFNELDKFDIKIKVIPNGLEKYKAFFLNKNLVFIDICNL